MHVLLGWEDVLLIYSWRISWLPWLFTHTHLVAFWKWLRLLVSGVYREQGRLFCAPNAGVGVYREQGGLFCAPMLVSGGYREQGGLFCAPMLVSGGLS